MPPRSSGEPLRRSLRPRARRGLARRGGHSQATADMLCWLAELGALTREHGAATARLWHEVIRPELDRHASDRHWSRIKVRLVERGIPHERVEAAAVNPRGEDAATGAAAIKVAERFKACTWRGCRRPILPARAPYFHARGEAGLTAHCAACRRERARISKRKHLESVRAYRATMGGRITTAKAERNALAWRSATSRWRINRAIRIGLLVPPAPSQAVCERAGCEQPQGVPVRPFWPGRSRGAPLPPPTVDGGPIEDGVAWLCLPCLRMGMAEERERGDTGHTTTQAQADKETMA